MTVTAISEGVEAPQEAPVHTVAPSLRQLIMSGQRFRDLRARELQLGTSDLVALGHLHRGGSMAPGKLSALMEVTSGTMTALLDRVEKAGFLRRERNPEDRRGLLIRLTPAGDHAMQWLDEQFEEVIHQALADVPGPAVEEFRAVLDLLSTSLDGDAVQDVASGPVTAQQPTPLRQD